MAGSASVGSISIMELASAQSSHSKSGKQVPMLYAAGAIMAIVVGGVICCWLAMELSCSAAAPLHGRTLARRDCSNTYIQKFDNAFAVLPGHGKTPVLTGVDLVGKSEQTLRKNLEKLKKLEREVTTDFEITPENTMEFDARKNDVKKTIREIVGSQQVCWQFNEGEHMLSKDDRKECRKEKKQNIWRQSLPRLILKFRLLENTIAPEIDDIPVVIDREAAESFF